MKKYTPEEREQLTASLRTMMQELDKIFFKNTGEHMKIDTNPDTSRVAVRMVPTRHIKVAESPSKPNDRIADMTPQEFRERAIAGLMACGWSREKAERTVNAPY